MGDAFVAQPDEGRGGGQVADRDTLVAQPGQPHTGRVRPVHPGAPTVVTPPPTGHAMKLHRTGSVRQDRTQTAGARSKPWFPARTNRTPTLHADASEAHQLP